MSCLRRLIIIAIFGLQLLTFGVTLIVLASAGVLGKAVIINEDDALVIAALNIASIAGTMLLILVLWLGGRTRGRHQTAAGSSGAVMQPDFRSVLVHCPRCDAGVSASVRFCPNCGLART